MDYIKRSPLPQKIKLESLILRPNVHFEALRSYLKPLDDFLSEYKKETIENAEIEMKYQGYIQKEEEQAEKLKRLEDVILRDKVDNTNIQSLSSEGREILIKSRPIK